MRQLLVIFSLLYLKLDAQESDLYLLRFQQTDSSFILNDLRYASAFNEDGYNNQPYFVSQNELWISSNADDRSNTDIYSLNIELNTIKRITDNTEAEYSPHLSYENRYLNCIVVDSSGDQFIWSYALDSNKVGKEVLNIDQLIGYYCELDSTHLAYFQLGDPNKLLVHDRLENRNYMLNADIGRCLKSPKSGTLMYVHKYSDDFWVLKSWNTEDRRPAIIKKMIPGSEDFETMANGVVLATKDSKIYKLEDDLWTEIFDLASYGISNLSRIAFNGVDTLAIINNPE